MTDAAALRVAIDGVHEAMRDLQKLNAQLKALGDGAKQGSNGAKVAMAQMKSAVADVQRAHASATGRIREGWRGVTGVLRTSAIAAGSIAGAFAGVLKVVKMFDEAEAFRRTLKINLGDAAGLKVAGEADRFAVRQGVDLSSARQGVGMLAGAGVGESELLPIFTAFAALAAKSGATAEGLSRAFYQFTQVASQGRLQGDELRVIQENGVQLVRLLKDAGLGGRIGSQKEPITFDEIKKVLLESLGGPDTKRVLEEQRKQASNTWQGALNLMQLEFIEPLGRQLAPSVVMVSGELTKLVKEIDPKAVAGFVKGLVEGGIGIAKWIKENKDLLLNIGKTVIAVKALTLGVGLVKDVIIGANGVITALRAFRAYLLAITAGKAVAGAAGAAGAGAAGVAGGAAIAGIAATVATVLAAAAVGAGAFLLTQAILDHFGYNEWLEKHFGINEEMSLPADPAALEREKNRKKVSAEEFSKQAQSEWYEANDPRNVNNPRPSHDAMGRPISYGITRAERNAAFAYSMGNVLR